ncbi:MAG: helix-turn-helix domain-containing protein [Chloroflexi bacterium]|nr:helix-turn-helix domain-containing protein [Chloroflexota bacterium]
MFAASYEQIDQTNTSQSRKRKRLTSSYSTDKGLPENYDYTDTGCDLAPSCLECPLALCKYDVPNWGRRNQTTMRDQEIVRLRGQGLKVSQIAKIVKTSERTVYRVALREGIQLPVTTQRRRKSNRRNTERRERPHTAQVADWQQHRMPEAAAG